MTAPPTNLPTLTDWQLLDRFATAQDQAAFTEVVRRHIHFVYNAARRMLGGPGAEADDVTQAVFLLLSQKARTIPRRGALAGWLFTAARFCCANVRKTQARRRHHEREAAMLRPASESPPPESPLTRVLDEGLSTLADAERQTILLRFLERRSTRETAAALAISPSAVEKRLERGLIKLRGFFSRKGHIIPATTVVSLLATESAKAAPAVLLPTAAAVGTAAPASILALAKGAATMMTIQSAKLVGVFAFMLLAIAGFGVVTASMLAKVPTPPHSATTSASATTTRIAAAGRPLPMLLRFDLLLTTAGADQLRAAATPIKTASIGYEALQIDAEKLRATAFAADAAKQILQRSRSRQWASLNSMPQASGRPDGGLSERNMFMSFTMASAPGARGQRVTVDPGQIENITPDRRSNAIRLVIADQLHAVRIQSPGAVSASKQVQVTFTGDVTVGQAVVFIGDLGTAGGETIVHASIWQVFSCNDDEYRYMRQLGTTEWLQESVAQHVAEADRTIAWNSRAHEMLEKILPNWERTLPGGSIVRLVGVADETRWPNCWWDAAGNPVLINMGYSSVTESSDMPANNGPKNSLLVAILVEDPTVVADPEPGSNFTKSAAMVRGEKSALTLTTVKPGEGVDIGVPSGLWKDAGKLQMGVPLEVDGMRATLVSVQPALPRSDSEPGSAWVQVKQNSLRDREMQIFAVNKAGQFSNPNQPEILLENDNHSDEFENTVMVKMAADDIDHLDLRWRPRVWTHFEKFAELPLNSPDEAVKIAASVPASRPMTTSAPTSLAGDTPESIQPRLLAAAKTHDTAKVRALFVAHDKSEEAYADIMAEEFTSMQILHDALDEKFKPQDVTDTFTNAGLLLDMKTPEGVSWKVEGDHAAQISNRPDLVLTGGPGSTLVRVNGEWMLDMSFPAPLTAEQTTQLEKYSALMQTTAAARRAFAAEISKGQYKDIYEARDAFRKLLPASP